MAKMFSPSHFNTSHPLPIYSLKSSSTSSSSTLTSTKIKNLIHTLIVSSMCRIIRALSKVKSSLVEILKDNKPNIHLPYSSHKKHSSKTKKIIMGSFRLHYNWASSRSSSHVVMPVPSRVFEGLPKAVTLSEHAKSHDNGEDCCHDSELASYLQWLEENDDIEGDGYKGSEKEGESIKDVDMLAEMFIANCHEKFKVEKEESYRRYQEMLVRSL
ncbi:hypothetical protein MtrunA17_Chr1g0175131 [Medicago truncatula]|uniref:Cotton fiber protein n=1 Tax=Medicago truncatula TaxID=3880 RepID=A0A396JPW1_MEDTR|nr:uncharacterized protein LOC25483509 [Medicago truncatula]RHN79244.1 hypothetical protein MtrunA17_Chr1g0175131 [Medicago truncatula]